MQDLVSQLPLHSLRWINGLLLLLFLFCYDIFLLILFFQFYLFLQLSSHFVMHICLHHLSACTVGEICVSLHGCKPSGMDVFDRVQHVRFLHLRALTHSRSDTEIPHKPFFESVQWCHFTLMNIDHMNNALSWIECNGILSVKEMALLI